MPVATMSRIDQSQPQLPCLSPERIQQIKEEHRKMMDENTKASNRYQGSLHYDMDLSLDLFKWRALLDIPDGNVRVLRSNGTVGNATLESYSGQKYEHIPPDYMPHPFVTVHVESGRKFVSLKHICELMGIDFSVVLFRYNLLRKAEILTEMQAKKICR